MSKGRTEGSVVLAGDGEQGFGLTRSVRSRVGPGHSGVLRPKSYQTWRTLQHAAGLIMTGREIRAEGAGVSTTALPVWELITATDRRGSPGTAVTSSGPGCGVSRCVLGAGCGSQADRDEAAYPRRCGHAHQGTVVTDAWAGMAKITRSSVPAIARRRTCGVARATSDDAELRYRHPVGSLAGGGSRHAMLGLWTAMATRPSSCRRRRPCRFRCDRVPVWHQQRNRVR